MDSTGRGRPAIGPKVPINFPADLLKDIETGASRAHLSRAAWVRRAAARALPEVRDGVLTPGDLVHYFTHRLRDAEPDHEIDDGTVRRLLAAADDGILRIEPFTTETLAVEAPDGRRHLSFVTRAFQVGTVTTTVYQVSFGRITYQREADGDHYGEYTLFLNPAAARTHHQYCREHLLRA